MFSRESGRGNRSRGGASSFSWDNIKDDRAMLYKEQYLGQSVMTNARFYDNHTVNIAAAGPLSVEQELRLIQEDEERQRAESLGLQPKKRVKHEGAMLNKYEASQMIEKSGIMSEESLMTPKTKLGSEPSRFKDNSSTLGFVSTEISHGDQRLFGDQAVEIDSIPDINFMDGPNGHGSKGKGKSKDKDDKNSKKKKKKKKKKKRKKHKKRKHSSSSNSGDKESQVEERLDSED